jgi:hypothetical protein
MHGICRRHETDGKKITNVEMEMENRENVKA